ncbi:DUF2642 domain-containing protein [Neobacillus sp. YIM B06451]|uniref:DUF2642 domain-containing protein n=1 Tax=Neobacillus sp. YIM B06451 TaxID=3070994 RepID=UPI00292F40E0|nr:DUF2642 domain-containing protein [Neobacillus sp. YIM B06451]
MKNVLALKGQKIEIEISGKTLFQGILIDIGQDIIVLFNGKDYLYIPFSHIHNLRPDDQIELEFEGEPPEMPIFEETKSVSYRKTLTNAKGKFVEIFVTGNKSIHGYILSVLNDYFVFYSPIYKTMLISLNHLKWLTPYQTNSTPYTLPNEELPVKPVSIPLQRSFEEQLKKLEGKLVVFDLGDHPKKIGLLKLIHENIAELNIASGETIYWKVPHIKMIHWP